MMKQTNTLLDWKVPNNGKSDAAPAIPGGAYAGEERSPYRNWGKALRHFFSCPPGPVSTMVGGA